MEARSLSALNLGRRFFLLTALGYLAALVSCVAVGWALSVPFLRSAHTDHLHDVARQQASAAAFVLDEVFDRAEYLARLPSVLDLARGTTEHTSTVSDRIDTFRTEDLRHARILDYEGATLYASNPGEAYRLFLDVELNEGFNQIGRVATGAQRMGRLRVRTDNSTNATHLLVAVPILINGVMEGAVVIEKSLGIDDALPGGSKLITGFQKELLSDTPGTVIASVPRLPLYVRLGDNAIEPIGGNSQTFTLVARILGGLSIVLLIPFLVMSFFGAKHLVAPTHALSRSRARLAQQQDQLRQQSEALRELAAVAELSRDAVIVTDRRARIIWVNQAFVELSGHTQEAVRGKNPGAILHGPDTDSETVQRIRSSLAAGEPVREEILNYDKDGNSYWIALSISPITDENGNVLRFAAISSDITERRAVQEELSKAQRETEHRATHDTLTGLPNRRHLDGVLESEVMAHSAPRTLVRVDLDFFKNVNDTHGHAAGDHVLRVVSDILQQFSRKGDLVARVGGDEFVVLLVAGTSMAEADALCERFRAEICNDIVFEGKTCRVGASFGVASALDGLVGNDKLLVGADAALYVSKAKGRNTTTLYTPEVHTDVLNKRRSAVEIERAIARKEFEPYFQPQVDAVTRTLSGVEALARWNHPEQGVLAPNTFLPLAEQLSLVAEIDDIIYAKGLSAIQNLSRDGHHVPKISFNVGTKQLENPLLTSVHKRYYLGETQIVFEILESVLVEEQDTKFALQIDLLRELGFGIEVDDFGSGHASIIGLMQLRPDAMKLDQRLIMPLTQDPRAIVTVRALVEIGRSQGIKITAEGVETEDHSKLLTELGVDTLQGYRFAKPMALNDLRQFLERHASFKNDPLPTVRNGPMRHG
jgi:diguanylate cyclase (GGDEF)-like protein/PAS domain S-box-containing protein